MLILSHPAAAVPRNATASHSGAPAALARCQRTVHHYSVSVRGVEAVAGCAGWEGRITAAASTWAPRLPRLEESEVSLCLQPEPLPGCLHVDICLVEFLCNPVACGMRGGGRDGAMDVVGAAVVQLVLRRKQLGSLCRCCFDVWSSPTPRFSRFQPLQLSDDF